MQGTKLLITMKLPGTLFPLCVPEWDREAACSPHGVFCGISGADRDWGVTESEVPPGIHIFFMVWRLEVHH